MFIARWCRSNQAPLGAAHWFDAIALGKDMPLLKELGDAVVGPCSYRHGAPSGAASARPVQFPAILIPRWDSGRPQERLLTHSRVSVIVLYNSISA